MPNGIRFFEDDVMNFAKGGTITVSSNTTQKNNCFDNKRTTLWKSSGQGTDGDQVYVREVFSSARSIDAIYVYKSNIKDLSFEYYTGSGWADVVSGDSISGGELIQSSDGLNSWYKFNSTQSLLGIGLKGSNTIVANQEKYVKLFLAFKNIGQLEFYPDFTPTYEPNQIDFKLEDGSHFIIEKGESFTGELSFKSHKSANDIAIASILMDYKRPYYVWINAGDEAQFDHLFKPYRFEDIFRVSNIGKYSPKLTKNYYRAGLNLKIKFEEVS